MWYNMDMNADNRLGIVPPSEADLIQAERIQREVVAGIKTPLIRAVDYLGNKRDQFVFYQGF